MKRTELKRKTAPCSHVWDYDAPSTSSTAIDRCIRCDQERPSKKAEVVVAGPRAPKRTTNAGSPKYKPLKPGRGFAASPAQQKKAREEPCVVTAQEALYGSVVDAAHLWPRGRGGCSDPLCCVPLVRHLHRDFDEGKFDLLPYLVRRRVPELCHALEHADGDVESLFRRLAPGAYRAGREAA